MLVITRQTYRVNFICSRVGHEQVLRNDAANRVVRIVARVALRGRVTNGSGRECSRLERLLRVTTNGCNLLRQLEYDRLVRGCRIRRRWILVLCR